MVSDSGYIENWGAPANVAIELEDVELEDVELEDVYLGLD